MIATSGIEHELQGVDLGDKRLNKRLVSIATRVAATPGKSFPKMVGSASELEAVYRFFGNESVGPDALLRPHQVATLMRCGGQPVVRVAHDSTAFFFTGNREGMGAVSKGEGFHAHFALAISGGEERAPLGVLGLKPFTRVKRGGTLTMAERQKKLATTPRREKESFRWNQLVTETKALGCKVPMVHLMDREADDYTLFAELIDMGERFVIRGTSKRVLNEVEHVRHRLEKEQSVLSRTVPLSKRTKKLTTGQGARIERDAILEVRAAAVEIPRGKMAQTEVRSLKVNVVQVFEPNPPEGEDAVEWILYTTEPIDSVEAIAAVVDHYRARWRIEEYFRALKSGCAFEARQLTDFKSLVRVLAVFAPVAWRLLALRILARAPETPPANVLFTDDQLALLGLLAQRRKRPMPKTPSVRDAMLAIAALGGHLKNNGDPGWITLGRGYEDFLLAEVGWRAALAQAAKSPR